jgi:PAS domain S-box-containing protein
MASETGAQHMPVDDFERISRIIRWLAIAAVLVILPDNLTRAGWLLALLVAAAIFNLTRYSNPLMRWRPYAAPATTLVADGVAIGLLLVFIGSVTTPYSAFLFFLLISAAYKLGARGVGITAAASIAGLLVIARFSPFAPIHLGLYQAVLVMAFAIAAVGLQLERLTRTDRQQRAQLARASRDNRAERSRLLALLNSVTNAVYVVDTEERVLQYNQAAVNLVGKSDLIGKSFMDVFPVHTRTSPDVAVDIFKGRRTAQHRRDLVVEAEAGASYDVDVQVTPIMLAGKKTTDYIIVAQDITKERTLDEQRREFISVTSHELRTPIAIMEAALSTALGNQNQLPKQTIQLLAQAHTKSLYLGNIMKDLGTISQAQNDDLPVELTRLDPAQVLRQLTQDFEAQVQQQGLDLRVTADPDTPVVMTTERHVVEILQNYVNNAQKYTKKGSITVTARLSKSGGVLFSVQDTGIGISPHDQKRLFVRFFRAEDYRTRQTSGIGLGLYLCQELAARIGAKVWAESTLNKGSTFYLEIPPAEQPAPVSADAAKV